MRVSFDICDFDFLFDFSKFFTVFDCMSKKSKNIYVIKIMFLSSISVFFKKKRKNYLNEIEIIK